jgi:peptidoglycan L-alanyl-D-glutamate endopeptidase CwlK
MSRRLDDLDPDFRRLAVELLARCCEQGIPLLIVDTLRTNAEQAANIRNGVSWTANSKHLPQAPLGKALAIDVCPYEVFQLHGPDKLAWSNSDPVWQRIGAIGEALGLRWGGRWKDERGNPRPDSGHFEWVRPQHEAPQ